jgi:hypothetical protein
MAITPNTITVTSVPTEGNEWAKSMYTASAADEEELIAGETGKYHYIKRLMIRTYTKTTISIGSGSDGTMTTLHLGPIPVEAASGVFMISFGEKGMKCDSGLALVVITTDATPIMIYVEGKTCAT